MGILDNKQRILDTLVTQEGKRQIAGGKLKPAFYSFSDRAVVYDIQGDNPPIALEATGIAQDQITFEADDSGKLRVSQFRNLEGQNVRVLNGRLVLQEDNSIVPGSDDSFASMASDLLSTSTIQFQRQQILASPPLLNQDKDEFLIAPQSKTFAITDTGPLAAGVPWIGSVNAQDSLFVDERLSHIPNFLHLPPVNEEIGGVAVTPIGNYPPIGNRRNLSFADLDARLAGIRQRGYTQVVSFTETSVSNRLVSQMFEVASDGAITKLDIIDFGIFTLEGNELSPQDREALEDEPGLNLQYRHVFFAGKVFVDDNGSQTFLNLFTLVFG